MAHGGLGDSALTAELSISNSDTERVALDEEEWRRRTLALARRFGLAEAPPGYIGFEARCWSCKKPAPVFLWPGIKDRAAPPEPSPETVRLRFSKTLRASYPANG